MPGIAELNAWIELQLAGTSGGWGALPLLFLGGTHGVGPGPGGFGAQVQQVVARARKIQRFLSQPFFVAETFTGAEGKYVSLKDSIAAFKGIINGDYDDLPEQAFYMVGTIDEVVEKAKAL